MRLARSAYFRAEDRARLPSRGGARITLLSTCFGWGASDTIRAQGPHCQNIVPDGNLLNVLCCCTLFYGGKLLGLRLGYFFSSCERVERFKRFQTFARMGGCVIAGIAHGERVQGQKTTCACVVVLARIGKIFRAPRHGAGTFGSWPASMDVRSANRPNRSVSSFGREQYFPG